jgi:hypothetical protein
LLVQTLRGSVMVAGWTFLAETLMLILYIIMDTDLNYFFTRFNKTSSKSTYTFLISLLSILNRATRTKAADAKATPPA